MAEPALLDPFAFDLRHYPAHLFDPDLPIAGGGLPLGEFHGDGDYDGLDFDLPADYSVNDFLLRSPDRGDDDDNSGEAYSFSSSTAAAVFAVNGERVEIRDGDVDPSATLLEFLRTRTRFTGPKLGCGEGECGACVVLLSTYDAATGATASSSLTLVHGLHHRAAVHTKLAGFHTTQCGF